MLSIIKCYFYQVKSIINSTIAIVGIQAINFLTPMLILPFISRAFGVHEFGLYATLLSYGNYVILVADYAFNNKGPLRVHGAVRDKRLANLLVNSTILKLFLLIPVIIAFVIISAIVAKADLPTIVCAILIPITTTLTPRWVIYSLGKLYSFAVISAVSRFSWMILMIILVRSSDDLKLLLIATAISQAVILVLSFRQVWPKDEKTARVDFREIYAILREDMGQFVATISGSFLREINVLVLSVSTSVGVVSIYAVADRIRYLITGLSSPITQSIFLYIVRENAKNGEANQTVRAISSAVVVLFVFVGSALVFIFSDQIVMLFGGAGFTKASSILRILCFLPFFNTINSILGPNTLLAEGREKTYSHCQIIIGVIGVPLTVVMIYFLSAVGAAFATVILEVLLVVFYSFAILRYNLFRKVWL
jgi:polysaccharide transporter, PST family